MLTAAHTIAPRPGFHPRRIGAEEPVTARIRSRAEAVPTLPCRRPSLHPKRYPRRFWPKLPRPIGRIQRCPR